MSDSPTRIAEIPAASSRSNVCSSADAAFADEHDVGRNPVAKPQGVLEVGVKAVEVAVIDPDQIGT